MTSDYNYIKCIQSFIKDCSFDLTVPLFLLIFFKKGVKKGVTLTSKLESMISRPFTTQQSPL